MEKNRAKRSAPETQAKQQTLKLAHTLFSSSSSSSLSSHCTKSHFLFLGVIAASASFSLFMKISEWNKRIAFKIWHKLKKTGQGVPFIHFSSKCNCVTEWYKHENAFYVSCFDYIQLQSKQHLCFFFVAERKQKCFNDRNSGEDDENYTQNGINIS